MFRPQKLPPIPYLLSNMIQPRKPRKFPEDERQIKSEKELAKLPMEQRKNEVRSSSPKNIVLCCFPSAAVLVKLWRLPPMPIDFDAILEVAALCWTSASQEPHDLQLLEGSACAQCSIGAVRTLCVAGMTLTDVSVFVLLQFRKRRIYLQQRAAEDRLEEDGPSSQVSSRKQFLSNPETPHTPAVAHCPLLSLVTGRSRCCSECIPAFLFTTALCRSALQEQC